MFLGRPSRLFLSHFWQGRSQDYRQWGSFQGAQIYDKGPKVAPSKTGKVTGLDPLFLKRGHFQDFFPKTNGIFRPPGGVMVPVTLPWLRL